MFSISFSEEPLEYPYDDPSVPAAAGSLVLGKCTEDFLANLGVWDKPDYKSHWTRQLRAVLAGDSRVALIVSYNDPKASTNLEIWRLYRDEDWVRFQNQLLPYSSLPPDFNVSDIDRYIKARVVTDEDGNRISEWNVHIRDIEVFLQRSPEL